MFKFYFAFSLSYVILHKAKWYQQQKNETTSYLYFFFRGAEIAKPAKYMTATIIFLEKQSILSAICYLNG